MLTPKVAGTLRVPQPLLAPLHALVVRAWVVWRSPDLGCVAVSRPGLCGGLTTAARHRPKVSASAAAFQSVGRPAVMAVARSGDRATTEWFVSGRALAPGLCRHRCLKHRWLAPSRSLQTTLACRTGPFSDGRWSPGLSRPSQTLPPLCPGGTSDTCPALLG